MAKPLFVGLWRVEWCKSRSFVRHFHSSETARRPHPALSSPPQPRLPLYACPHPPLRVSPRYLALSLTPLFFSRKEGPLRRESHMTKPNSRCPKASSSAAALLVLLGGIGLSIFLFVVLNNAEKSDHTQCTFCSHLLRDLCDLHPSRYSHSLALLSL